MNNLYFYFHNKKLKKSKFKKWTNKPKLFVQSIKKSQLPSASAKTVKKTDLFVSHV